MQEWRLGMTVGSLGPRMGERRRLQVEKVGVLDARTMSSARVWFLLGRVLFKAVR
jgi:hypothetical protein